MFIHFSTTDTLPYYVEIYINELTKHFDKVKVLTNNSKISKHKYFIDNNIDFIHLKNQGYDFGMFYRYIINENLENISQIALINDSNILLKKLHYTFDWADTNEFDFWGIIDSNEKPWFSNHTDNYHLQSHFLVFNSKAINFLPAFFNTLNINEILNESDVKKLRRLVIEKWEIGLTQYFIRCGLKIGTYISSNEMHSKYQPKKQNVTHSIYHKLVSEGYPFIKKKVLLGKNIFSGIKKEKWKMTIENFGHNEWDFKKILDSVA